MFYVPEGKLARLKTAIVAFLHCKSVSVRKLASIVGQIISMSLPIARLRTRSLYHVLNSRRSWSDQVYIASDAWEEL